MHCLTRRARQVLQIRSYAGRDTVVDVQSKIYLRDKVGKLGLHR